MLRSKGGCMRLWDETMLSCVDKLDKIALRCDMLRSLVFEIVDCRFGLGALN